MPKDVIKHAPNIDPAAELGDDVKSMLDGCYSAMELDNGS